MGGEPENGQVKREKGSLFSFQNNRVTSHISKVGISNGLAWSTELKKFYYIDSHRGTIDEYDFDIESGNICECYFLLMNALLLLQQYLILGNINFKT